MTQHDARNAESPLGQPAAAEIQAFLVTRIAEQLSVPDVPTDTPFTTLGLDSIAALEISLELEKWLERDLPQTLLWDHPTIAALALHLSGDGKLATAEDTSREEVAARAVEPEARDVEGDADVSIVGLGVRLPGAASPSALADLLLRGEIRTGRLEKGARLAPSSTHADERTQIASVLEDRLAFDAAFFRIAPSEALQMDPQQRVLLETTHHALEDAGLPRAALVGRSVGVFVGASHSDHALRSLTEGVLDAHTGTGVALSILANRVSYSLGVVGPSLTVDTACSSSLVALHLARVSLERGECELAIVGGIGLVLSDAATSAFAEVGLLSKDGSCRPFSTDASGYRRGDGCVVVVLARAPSFAGKALRIRAHILGTGINHGGRTNGLLAPSGAQQEQLLSRVLREANIAPDTVAYVEAHGTATPVGDEVEARAIAQAYRTSLRATPLRIGSLKANFGHLEAAAGLASVAKVLVAMERRCLLATPGVSSTRALPAGVVLQNTTEPWAEPLRAGVSAFGFGGANAHVLLGASAEAFSDASEAPKGPYPLVFSARSSGSLDRLIDDAGKRLRNLPSERRTQALAILSSTLCHHRDAFDVRAGFVARDADHALTVLGEARTKSASLVRHQVSRVSKVAFLFPGVGESIAGSLHVLAAEPRVRERLDALAQQILEEGGPDVRPLLLGPPRAHTLRPKVDIIPTALLHPALFVLQVLLVERWASAEVRPDVVLGHSLGELAAAVCAGALPMRETLRFVVRRAALAALEPEGRMLAAASLPEGFSRVAAGDEGWAPMLADGLFLVADQGEDGVVVAGTREAVQAFAGLLERDDIAHQWLVAQHAFHTPSMQSVARKSLPDASALLGSSPFIPFVSSLRGETLGTAIMVDGAYWTEHVQKPLRTAAALAHLQALHRPDVLIEIGPSSSLGRLLIRNLEPTATRPLLVASAGASGDAFVRAWTLGLPLDASILGAPSEGLAELPYPFERDLFESPRRERDRGLREGLIRRRIQPEARSQPASAHEREPTCLRTLEALIEALQKGSSTLYVSGEAEPGLASIANALVLSLQQESTEEAPTRGSVLEIGSGLSASVPPRAGAEGLVRMERDAFGRVVREELQWASVGPRKPLARPRKVAVIGTGELGTKVCAALEVDGIQVERWTRRPVGGVHRLVDLGDASSVAEALEGVDWVVACAGPSAHSLTAFVGQLRPAELRAALEERAQLVDQLEALGSRAPVVVVSSVSAFLGGAGLGLYAALHAGVDLTRAQQGSNLGWIFWDGRCEDALLLEALSLAVDLGPGSMIAAPENVRVEARSPLLASRPGHSPMAAPEGATEEAVAKILSLALGLVEVGRDEDFFALGGTSLLAMRVLRDVTSRFGVRVSVRELLEVPTVEGIALAVDEARLLLIEREALGIAQVHEESP